jgi:hypothetical protein
MTNLQQSIEQQVGVFVHGVSELVRRAAIEALEQAIVLPTPPVGPAKQQDRPKRKVGGSGKPRVERKAAPPRDPSELSGLTERLYAVIVAQPGETMEVLAPVVGCPGTELRVSIGHLLARGRVKKAGERRSTRYFPMGTDQG